MKRQTANSTSCLSLYCNSCSFCFYGEILHNFLSLVFSSMQTRRHTQKYFFAHGWFKIAEILAVTTTEKNSSYSLCKKNHPMSLPCFSSPQSLSPFLSPSSPIPSSSLSSLACFPLSLSLCLFPSVCSPPSLLSDCSPLSVPLCFFPFVSSPLSPPLSLPLCFFISFSSPLSLPFCLFPSVSAY